MKLSQGMMLGAVIVIGTIGAVMVRHDRRERTTLAMKHQDEIAALRAEVEELRSEGSERAMIAAQLGRASRRWEGAFDRSSAAEDEPATEEVLGEADPGADMTEADILASVDGVFDAEQPDDSWSKQATFEAETALEAGLPEGSKLEKVECRSSLCRAETSHANVEDFKSFVNDSFLGRERAIWNGGFYTSVVHESEDGVVAVSYVAKEGQSVPLPDVP